VSLAALALLLSWMLVPIADRYGWPRWFTVALAVPLAAATEPVRETLGFGQVNLLLALLIYADFAALRNRARRAGPAAGTALPARLYDSPTTPTLMWLAFDMLLLAVGLSRAKTAHAEGDELTAFTLVGLTANAICPISWSHHLVFLVPALVILGDTALRRRAAAH